MPADGQDPQRREREQAHQRATRRPDCLMHAMGEHGGYVADQLLRRAPGGVGRRKVRPRHGADPVREEQDQAGAQRDRKSTRLNSSHGYISYAVFCLKKKKKKTSNRAYMIS